MAKANERAKENKKTLQSSYTQQLQKEEKQKQSAKFHVSWLFFVICLVVVKKTPSEKSFFLEELENVGH